MANHEHKDYADAVHVYLAFCRTKDGNELHKTMRQVIKNPLEDLAILEERCRLAGGTWRIHRTVNRRDTEKARKWLLKKLIDYPEGRGFIDSLWRTALLQPECVYGTKCFMLDVDTKEEDKVSELVTRINTSVQPTAIDTILERVETPNGWHFVTVPFDTREVCLLPYVSLKRDGYIYIKTIGDLK